MHAGGSHGRARQRNALLRALKPVGLTDPRTGKRPYAVVQLRAENRDLTAYNMVGFQTRLRWPEQKRVFSMIPGLEKAEFLRFGSIHRNTFINAPLHLNADLTLKSRSTLFFAGQITGVEGYIESTAIGLLAESMPRGNSVGCRFSRRRRRVLMGLVRHITESDPAHFQPSNINFGLMPVNARLPRMKDKKARRTMVAEAALAAWQPFVSALHRDCPSSPNEERCCSRKAPGAGKQSLEEHIDAFLRSLAVEKNVSAHTVRAYRNDLGDFAAYCPNPPEKVELVDIRGFIATQTADGKSKTTVARRLAALRSFFTFCTAKGVYP